MRLIVCATLLGIVVFATLSPREPSTVLPDSTSARDGAVAIHAVPPVGRPDVLSEAPLLGEAGGASPVRGLATWYDAPSKQDAAAGPSLRRALGPGWRGEWVRVSHVGDGTVRSVTVRLTDWCACGPRNGKPTVLDLDDQAFADLASLGAGVISVRVEAIDGVPAAPTGPPTDVEP